MGVYIEGMEMPTSGTYEVSIDNSYGKDKTVMSLFVRGDGGLICCGCYEIVPVPPHGRLGDMDAIARKIRRFGDYVDFTKDEIAGWFENGDFETIIPAEEVEA